MADIASDLLKTTPVNYFSYGRYYKNGGTFFLNNDNHEILEAWLLEPHSGAKLRQGVHIWEDVWTEDEIRRNKRYNLNCGLSIVHEYDEYSELISFGSNYDMNIAHYFINNFELSTQFGLYFKDQASRLIEKAAKNLIYPEKKIVRATDSTVEPPLVPNTLFDHMKIKTYYINDELSVSFTPREKQCFDLFLIGNSSVTIGNKLGLSQKTVQTHLKNIKDKFNCQNNSELIAKLWALDLLHSDFFDPNKVQM